MNKNKKLKNGYTTGACATAATKAALLAILHNKFAKTSTIILPKGQSVTFTIEKSHLNKTTQNATATIIKDAGDDPDITHGALIRAKVQLIDGKDIIFKAGRGIGIVSKPGLPIPVGQPAISAVPKQMMENVVNEIVPKNKTAKITLEIENGEKLARQTWNGKLGIVGGLSILGTSGIVKPYSCSAWIHSLHQGIDVARAEGVKHIIAATGSTSQQAAQSLYAMPANHCLEMGDFVGAVLKYIKKYPIAKLTIAGGFAKITKLAQGNMDLHSNRSQVNLPELKKLINSKTEINANSAAQMLEIAQNLKIDLAKKIGQQAQKIVTTKLEKAPVKTEIIIVDRQGKILCQIK